MDRILDFPFSSHRSAHLMKKKETGRGLARLCGHSPDDTVLWFRTFRCHFLFFFNFILIGGIRIYGMLLILVYIFGDVHLSNSPNVCFWGWRWIVQMWGKWPSLYGFMSSINKWDISSHADKPFSYMTIFSMYSFSTNDTNNHILLSSFIE